MMKHLKLFENYNDDYMLLDIVKDQALKLNKPKMLEYAIEQGFDLEKNKWDLIDCCKKNKWYDAIKMLDTEHHQKLVGDIKTININGHGLKNIQVKTLINLTDLRCSDNKLTDLKGLEEMTNLTKLNITGNKLTDLKGIEKLTKLEYLYCGYNQLTSLKEIESLSNLRLLECKYNQLTDLDGIYNLTSLLRLECYRNKLESIEGIENLTNLKYLMIYGNNLTSLKGIESLIDLNQLECDNNNFPPELEALGDDIEKWQEYYRNN